MPTHLQLNLHVKYTCFTPLHEILTPCPQGKEAVLHRHEKVTPTNLERSAPKTGHVHNVTTSEVSFKTKLSFFWKL